MTNQITPFITPDGDPMMDPFRRQRYQFGSDDSGQEPQVHADVTTGSAGAQDVKDSTHQSPWSPEIVSAAQARVAGGRPQMTVPEISGKRAGLGIALGALANIGNPHGGQQVADAMFNEPYQRAFHKYQADNQSYNQDVGVLKDVAQDQNNEAHWADMKKLRDAQADWYSNRDTSAKPLDIQHLHAQAVQHALDNGQDPSQDPTVQSYEQAMKAVQKPTNQKHDPYEDWRALHTDKDGNFTGNPLDYVRANAEAKHFDRPDPADKKATKAQFATVERHKGDQLTALEKERSAGTLDDNDYLSRKQGIQDNYEHEIDSLGGTSSHFDVTQQGKEPQVQPHNAAPAAAASGLPKPPKPGAKLDVNGAAAYLKAAGGNRQKAEQMAQQDQWTF